MAPIRFVARQAGLAKKTLEWNLKEVERLLQFRDSNGLADYVGKEHHWRVRKEAARALLEIGDGRALEIVSDILQGDTEILPARLIEDLAEVPGDEALLLLANALHSPNMFLHSLAARVIGLREELSVFPYLVRVCRDPFPAVRKLGQRLLRRRVQERPEQLVELRPENLDGVMEELDFDDVWKFLPRDTHPRVRQAAIKRMSEFESEHAVNFLLSTCFAAEPPFCDLAMEAIEKNEHVKAEDLQPFLDYGAEELFPRAFACFARRTGPEGVETLTAALHHRDPSVRSVAVREMARLFGSGIVAVVSPLLSDKDPAVCGAVLEVLAKAPRQMVENPLVKTATEGPPEVREKALRIAAELSICAPELTAAYLQKLDEGLKDPRPEGELLDLICDIFHSLKPARPVYMLIHLVRAGRSASPRLRRVALEVMRAYPPEQRFEAYPYLEGSSDMNLVREMAFELGEAQHSAAKVPLIRVAMGRKRKDARKAREYLYKMPEMRDVEHLIDLIHSKHLAVKQFGIQRLKEIGDPQVVALLLQAIEEGNEDLQRQALERLAELGNEDMAEMAGESGAGAIMGDLDREAIEDLGDQADPRAVQILLEASKDEDEIVQLAAVEALGKFTDNSDVVERLIDCIGYGSVPVRQEAVQILGKNKIVVAVDPLIRALGNIFLRSYVEEALRNIGDRRGYLAVVRRKKREKMFPSRAKLEREKMKRGRGARKKALGMK